MKKLILSAAIILGSYSAFAQTSQTTQTTTTQTETVEKKYTEIKPEEVPSSVILALKTEHPDAVIKKAYTNENKEFKLDIKVGNQESTVYTDATGKLKKK